MSNILDNKPPDRGGQSLLQIEIIVDEDVACPVSMPRLQRAAAVAAAHQGFQSGEICVRVTNDLRIHEINRDHLRHDYPTDVISFTYRATPPTIEGELVVSVDTASRRAQELGWSVDKELILYVVHGTLHIVGMNDKTSHDRESMRAAERSVMIELGLSDIAQFAVDTDSTTPPSSSQETRRE